MDYGRVLEHENSRKGILFTEGSVVPISREQALLLARNYHHANYPTPGYELGAKGVKPIGEYYFVSVTLDKWEPQWIGYMVDCRTGEVVRIPGDTFREREAWVMKLIE